MATLPTLKQLQYLVALSEHLNFTRAAESCFVTQSTLSAGLKELEEGLGTQLVERSRQTVIMTPAGMDVAHRARAILAATQDMVESAQQAGEPMCGSLRLGIIPTIAPFLLPAALRQLRERYPHLQLALREDLTTNLLTRLESGQLDFALIALPFATGKLLVESLFDEQLWLVGRQDDPEIASGTVAPSPAWSDRLILLEEGHCLREHALLACGNLRTPSRTNEATSLLTLIQMVDSGLGIGLIPEMAVNSGLAASPTLITQPLNPLSQKRTIALVARPSTSRHSEMQALANVIRDSRQG